MRKPFQRNIRGKKIWYVQWRGKFVRLGADETEALEKYGEMVRSGQPVRADAPVESLIDEFLTFVKDHQASATHVWYAKFLESFRDHLPPGLKLSELQPFHVTKWTDKAFKGQSPTTVNAAIRACQRVFNWAKKSGRISVSPIRDMEKPAAESREVWITPEQYAVLLAHVDENDPFRDVLETLWETGCRPGQELCRVEARHFFDGKQWTFPKLESKGKRHKRIVPLNCRALGITQRLALKYPTGPLFRNRKGNAWTAYALNCRFSRLEKKTGIECFPYAVRHSFISNALVRGVDPVTLAIIVGHRDASMILKVYQHLHLNTGHVRTALALATGEVPAKKSAAG